MYLVHWLCFLTVEKWPFVGHILYVPVVFSLLVIRAIGVPPMWVA